MIKKLMTFFSLFGSLSTLLCCALPVTLVSLGMGATFASLTSSIPGILWLVGHKDILFVLTGVMLIVSYFLMKHGEKQALSHRSISSRSLPRVKRTQQQNVLGLCYYLFYRAFIFLCYSKGFLWHVNQITHPK